MAAFASKPVRRLGRYELLDEFARGGMAAVHLGRLVGPVGFSRTVAIKRLHPAYASDPQVVRMFIDEANLASRIRHPNVVPTLDVLTIEGELYLVMEYVRGVSLARALSIVQARNERVPVDVALALLGDVFSGLHAAHEATGERGEPLGIVHRDVSPQNVLVGDDGVARVLDFGVAKAASRMQSTAEGQIKGKLAYMSPEQLAGGPLDRRSDVFAASIVAWETLVGAPLFARDDPGATLNAVTHAPIVAPSTVRDDGAISRELDELVLAGLERDPARRAPSALAVAHALEGVGRRASARAVAEWLASVTAGAVRADAEILARVGGAELATASGIEGAGTAAAFSSSTLPHSPLAAPQVHAHADAHAPYAPTLHAPLQPPTQVRSAAPTLAILAPRRRARGVAIALLLVAVGAFSVYAFARRAPSDAHTADAASALARAAPAAPETATVSAAAAASLPPLAASTQPAPTSTSTSPAAPRAAPTSVPGSRRARTPVKVTTPSRADCRVVNPDGTLGYRPECLR